MKNKLVFAALLCIFSFKANAQTEKGKVMLGGFASFSTHKFEGQSVRKTIIFNTSLRSGYFIKNNLAIGLGLEYNHQRDKENNPDNIDVRYKQIQRSYGLSPFTRYYFNINEKFKIFNELSIYGRIGDSKDESQPSPAYPSDYKFKQIGLNLKPGLAYFPIQKIAIEFSFPMLNYQKTFFETKYMENPDAIKTKGEEFQLGIDTFKPTIGVNYHF